MTMYEIESRIKEAVAAGESYKIYRICLEGYMDLEQQYDWKRLEELPKVAAVISNLRPDYDYSKLAEEDSLLGRYVMQLQRLPQDVITKKAMEYGVNALLGHDICR